MEMSKRTEEALRASIKHWEIDVIKNGEYANKRNCPMCIEYANKRNCPMCMCRFQLTNKNGHDCEDCILSPICDNQYQEYADASYETRKQKARYVVNAMKRLLPK